ncbi:hypothetical protein EVAR_81223_1 [Eumeta japonica]|uniref:Uncharacterized protein n=1 Tax=Eumeta variegata TaxID=151549 RepID=A0A4C1V271_EUMVA|nr:hypothetical protein EVAR_81223_1 [Eumeta japonica]
MPREFDAMHRMVRFKTIPFAAAFMIMLYALAEICMSVVVLIGFHKLRRFKRDDSLLVFKAYYVLSIRSQIKIMECPDDGDEVDTSRDIEMKISGDETQETDLNAQSVKNIERILNDETLDSEYEISEFGSSDALVQ